MSTIERYKFKVGDIGLTRHGAKYRVICIDRASVAGVYTVVAMVLSRNEEETPFTYKPCGTCIDGQANGLDLMPPRPKMWMEEILTFWRLYDNLHEIPVAHLVRNRYAKKEARALFAKMFDAYEIVDMP